MRVSSVEMVMELDTGAALSVISERTYQKMWPHGAPDLEPSTVSLHTYTGEQLEVLGSVSMQVEYKNQHECLPLLVVKGCGSSLLGRNWFQKVRLDWPEIHQLQETGTLERILQKQISIDSQVQPRFCKPHPVPFDLRNKVERELE